jgi:hypothetical protein
MTSSETFDGTWWSVEVPTGWRARADRECATFQQSPSLGAFQISSARKDSPITDTDLEAFAHDAIPEGTRLVGVAYGDFSGFTAYYQKDGLMWRVWWLRSGRLMIYATYNVSKSSIQEAIGEQAELERILATLKPRNDAAL